MKFRGLLVLSTLALPVVVPAASAASRRIALRDDWKIQSSAKVAAKGDVLSKPGFATDGWHAATVPNTVVGALVENGTFKDPYFGMNLRSIPGTTYPIGHRFTLLPTPDDSPYRSSWWYRREIEIPKAMAGRSFALHFDAINYRANVWVNGTRIASSDDVAGAFRMYEFDVTKLVRAGGRNAVAVEVFIPEPTDLAIMWVDWNPTPADKNMGLWGESYLTDSGPIALRHPHVITKLDLPSLATARLTVTAEAWNTSDAPVSGVVRGTIESITFSQPVTLGPREHKTVRFTPAETPALNVSSPRIWWPYRMGQQPLYTAVFEAEAHGAPSDRQEIRFGIVEHTSELTGEGHRLFKVNGKPILIRGGGWASDMMLRPASKERLEAEMRYVREMGLNTVRLEGKLESDLFYEIADRMGILVMPGWCCCDQWEKWDKWTPENYRVAPLSLSSQITRLRNHPSVFVWLNGSDFAPPAPVEKTYLDIEEKLEWSRPVLSSATEAKTTVTGDSGVKMRGPYDYVPPCYWQTDKKNGGAFGFSTEIGPGGAVPPIESLKQMLPADHLWPIDDVWNFHAGGDEFKDIHLFTEALEGRYGKATGVEDYARKAQALTYESQRAMFEGYSRNRYTSTGVIQWMLNNAWPGLIWHLYDYYLRPGGGYFGTKQACEPVHIQYSYDDRSVVVVNDTLEAAGELTAKVEVLNLDLTPKFTHEGRVAAAADAVTRVVVVPEIKDLSTTYFLKLTLRNAAGTAVSSNFYWLAAQDDVLDSGGSKWYYTPVKTHSDLTALATLPQTTLRVQARGVGPGAGPDGRARVRIENTGKAIAFQVRLKLIDGENGPELLPVFWDDNYVALLPGEVREFVVAAPQTPQHPIISVQAWNTLAVSVPVSR
jgi:exo-1,4-beta-D-glucosaminidase